MTVYLVYYDTARVGRRWLGRTRTRTRGQLAWGDRQDAIRFPTRRHAEAALRAARRRAAGIEDAHDQNRSTHHAHV